MCGLRAPCTNPLFPHPTPQPPSHHVPFTRLSPFPPHSPPIPPHAHQPTAVPQRWCDRRVRVIQADALALSPLLLLRLLSSLQAGPPLLLAATLSLLHLSPHLALTSFARIPTPPLLRLHTFHPSPPESFDARPAHPHPSTHNRSHPDPAYPDTGGGGSRGTGAREPAGEAAREAGAERAAAGTECVAAVVERPSARVQGAQQVGGRSAQGCGEGGAAAQGGVLAVGGHMVVKLLEGDDTPGTVVGGGGQWWAVVGSGGQYGDAAGIGGRESGNTPCEEVNATLPSVPINHRWLANIPLSTPSPLDFPPAYVAACRPLFSSVTRLRPKATRASSREIYVIAKGFRGVPKGFEGF
ncbi:unnamed protein product [Closterium sp. NIES-64]|nr:unnamed protein product [Closterium sp. NIES-64]